MHAFFHETPVETPPELPVGSSHLLPRPHPDREPERPSPAGPARVVALVFALATSTLFGLFVILETFNDPGGWKAVGLVSLWLVPLAALAGVGWYRPHRARLPIALAVALVLSMAMWRAVDLGAWRRFEDRHGPVAAVAAFALGAALAFYAYRRPRLGGALMVLIGAAPPVLSSFGSAGVHSGASIVLLGVPAVVAGLLFLWSALLEGPRPNVPVSAAAPGALPPRPMTRPNRRITRARTPGGRRDPGIDPHRTPPSEGCAGTGSRRDAPGSPHDGRHPLRLARPDDERRLPQHRPR
jgi:hypothetical protein